MVFKHDGVGEKYGELKEKKEIGDNYRLQKYGRAALGKDVL